MTFDDLFNFPKKPGIYFFRNTKNNKYYIGQAEDIRERVLKHKTNFQSGYYPDAHLYRAWRKHGIEAFEAGVLEIVNLSKGDMRNSQLDKLEIMYIEKFNSYGTGGYNQTLGGDGGIKGYKFTNEQKKRMYINGLIQGLDDRNKLLFYDVWTNQYGETPSFQIINDIFNKDSRYQKNQICYFKRYIFAKTEAELKDKITIYRSRKNVLSYESDDEIENLQEKINQRVAEIRKEIDEFFEKYGKAKYNRKDNKTKKDELHKLQKTDLESGISKKEYMEKYNIKNKDNFYKQVHKLCPNWEDPNEDIKKICSHMSDEMREDILENKICCSKFIQRYKVSEATFYRFKFALEDELGIKIVSNNPGKNIEMVSEEQENDILNGITAVEYMKKYNLCEETFYEHRKYVSSKHPEYKYEPVKNNKKVDIELIREDIENGITKTDFSIKYNLSGSCYIKYKKIILRESNKDSLNITDEQKSDIEKGMLVDEYMKKHKVSKSTFYNHRKQILGSEVQKRHITLEDIISDEQRNDLLSGMSYKDYMVKYNCSEQTYYKHRKHIIPNDDERCKSRYDFDKKTRPGITEEQKQDLLNGISERDFVLKYNASHSTYKKYKKLVNEEKDNKDD